MLEALENMTRVAGRMLRRQPHPSREGYDLVSLQLEETQAVDGRVDLLSRHRGMPMLVTVRSALFASWTEPEVTRLELRARLTPDGALAEPHPQKGDFCVSAWGAEAHQ